MIVLGQDKFLVPLPGAMRSFSLQQRIIPVAGRIASVFIALLGNGADVATLADMDITKVLPSALPYLGNVFSEMPAGELEALTKALLGDAKMNGKPLFGAPGGDPFDALMQGRTTDTWRLLWHALEVWYPDFFIRVRSLTASAAKASPLEESTTSPPAGPVSA